MARHAQSEHIAGWISIGKASHGSSFHLVPHTVRRPLLHSTNGLLPQLRRNSIHFTTACLGYTPSPRWYQIERPGNSSKQNESYENLKKWLHVGTPNGTDRCGLIQCCTLQPTYVQIPTTVEATKLRQFS